MTRIRPITPRRGTIDVAHSQERANIKLMSEWGREALATGTSNP